MYCTIPTEEDLDYVDKQLIDSAELFARANDISYSEALEIKRNEWFDFLSSTLDKMMEIQNKLWDTIAEIEEGE
jgi:hypothetical protein